MKRAKPEDRPVLLGFQTVRTGVDPAQAQQVRRELNAYAHREGFRLGKVFVHDEGSGSRGALAALLRAATNPNVTAVAVLTPAELSQSPRVQRLIRERLKEHAGVDVRVVQQPTTPPGATPDKPATDARTQAQAGAVDSTRVQVEIVTTSARTVVLEFRITSDTVEAWSGPQLVAVFARDRLRTWLDRPSGWLVEGTVMFSVQPSPAGDRVVISLPDALPWTLSAAQRTDLRQLV
jgi:hypothetical protein